jgi:hypothetical protein
MKNPLVFAIIITACILAWILVQIADHNHKPKSAQRTIQPDLTLEVPSCRVLNIGGCPYMWCVANDGLQRSTSGLATMSPTCEAQSAVVFTGKSPAKD